MLNYSPDGHGLHSTGWRNLTIPTDPIGWNVSTTAASAAAETGTSVYLGQTGWAGTGTGFAMGTGTFQDHFDKNRPTSTCTGCVWTGLPDPSNPNYSGNSTTSLPSSGFGLKSPSFGLMLFVMALVGCF